MRRSPRLMMIASMALFGTLAPFVRHIPVASSELALYRALLAALLLGGYLMASRRRLPLKQIRRELPLLLLSGAAMGVNWILLFEAYKHTTVSTATLVYYFAPVIVTLLSPVLFKEKITKRQILCFFMSTLGIVMITGTGSGGSLTGVLFALGAACLYAAVILLNKFIRNVTGLHRTLVQFVAAALVLLPYTGMSSGFSLHLMDTLGWVCLLVVGLVHTGLNYCMYFSALKDMPGQQAAILSYIDPLVAVLISVAFLHEPLTLAQGVGGGLILGFTLINELAPAGDS